MHCCVDKIQGLVTVLQNYVVSKLNVFVIWNHFGVFCYMNVLQKSLRVLAIAMTTGMLLQK